METLAVALQKPPAERESYLRTACAGDDDLRREIADTITWEERMGEFLLHPMAILNDPSAAFRPGDIVDERFEIVRQIGEGGMSIVYEAFDRKRRQRVALKFPKDGFQSLISPELESALRVRHPNICVLNQVHTAETEDQQVDFLAMEYVDGETLARRLSRDGKLPEREALEIARQLCAGVAEAHRSGIVHRDLKPGNVMLSQSREGGLHVVVMDFGLAGAIASDSSEGGTPGYMAPEVTKGEKASCASDIYSLGVILYEIVTGQRPVAKASEGSNGQARFPAPSTLTKGLDRRWDRVILSCLNTAPGLRPSAGQVIAGLEKRPVPKAPLVVLAMLAVIALAIPQIRQRLTDFIWPPPNVRLAVLPPVGTTGSADVGPGLLQDVSGRIQRMSTGSRTVVVMPPSEMVARNVRSPEQARDVVHATHALHTSLKTEGDDLVVQAEVIDLATGTKLRELTARYSPATRGTEPATLAGLVSLALRLRGPAVKDVLSPAATPAYDLGWTLLQQGQQSFDDAIASFEESARLDPRSPLPLAGLVEVQVLKYEHTLDKRGLEAAGQALRTAESLSPDSPRVRMAAARLKLVSSQREEALADFRRVQELEPRNEQVYMGMGQVYGDSNRPSDAIAAYQKAIELDPDYYAGYHALGKFYYFQGNYVQAAEQFQKSVDKAPGLYDEWTNLGAALDELGRDDEAERALTKSLSIRETPRALNSMGAMRAYQKRDEEAVSYYRRAIELVPSEYVYLENLADSYRRLGRASEAKAAYTQARVLVRHSLDESPGSGYHRGFVAYISARLGDRERAGDEIAQALLMSPKEAKVTRNAVLTYETLGDRDEAFRVLELGATPDLLRELNRQPDLADFCRDPRFKQLVDKISH
jgi:serine/threonine protein kinase/tetratricopeptide (TPR) repeat protein